MGRKTIEQQIMEVLSVGDTVYLTDAGELDYGSIRQRWWLTHWGAERAMERRGRGA